MENQTILLVDDEDIVRDVGFQMLEAFGYKVYEAASGKEAVKLFEEKQGHIQLVILDMIMPEMGGKEVFEKIKKINPHIKVLLSSGYNADSQAMEIMDKGCNGFIQKPFNMKELSSIIKAVL